jgi:hypothetical protein
MADYKYSDFLESSQDDIFDKLYHPAATTPFSGIYRCHECGREVVSIVNRELPSQNHHQHAANAGPIRWRLIVRRQL